MTMRRWPVYVVLGVWFAVFCFIAVEASGKIVLTVEKPGFSTPILYTDFRIRVLPQVSFSTFDPWDRQYRHYTGVELLSLLEDIGHLDRIAGIEVISRNNYRAEMSIADLQRYRHLLSYQMDGSDYAQIEDGNKGPLAIAVDMGGLGGGERTRVERQFVWWIEKIILK